MIIAAKKSLGQNFLRDDTIVGRIVESANLTNDDVVIEIGPGMGVLTEKLAKVCKKVIAIELDDRLIEFLQDKFKENKKVGIIHGDILKINFPELVEREIANEAGEANETRSYKVVANLPYYITSPIVRLLLETQYPPSEIIVMVQKEVAQRICAKAGSMSILAVAVQYYAQPEYLFTVSRAAFEPMPKVESAIIKITRNKKQDTKDNKERKKFFRIVRAGFSAKRKTLANNLSSSLQSDKKEIEKKLESLGFSKNVRAQELGLDDWKKLAMVLGD